MASELGDNEVYAQSGSRALLGSETFTTSDAYNSLSDSLTFLGNGRTMVRFGTSYQYDSNVFTESSQRLVTRQSIVRPASSGSPAVTKTITELEDQDVQGGSVFRADLSLGFRGGAPSGPGLSYSLIYSGQYYLYETESGSDSSFDNALRGDITLRGGYTEVSAFAGFAQNGGYGYSSTLNREGRTAKSVRLQCRLRSDPPPGDGIARVWRRLSIAGLRFRAPQRPESLVCGRRLVPRSRVPWAHDLGTRHDLWL